MQYKTEKKVDSTFEDLLMSLMALSKVEPYSRSQWSINGRGGDNYYYTGFKDVEFSSRVVGGIIEPNRQNEQGIIYLDNALLFDTPITCPVILPLPTTDNQVDYVIDLYKWLGTSKGFMTSYRYNASSFVYSYPSYLETNFKDDNCII